MSSSNTEESIVITNTHDENTHIENTTPSLFCGCNCGACIMNTNYIYTHQENNNKHTKECLKCWEKIAEEMTQEYNEVHKKTKHYEEEENWKMYYYEGQYYKDMSQ